MNSADLSKSGITKYTVSLPWRKAVSFAAAIAMVQLASTVAHAHGLHITYGPTFYGTFPAGSGGSFPVPQFDPSLGTLTEIDLLVTGHSDGGSNQLENLSAFPGSATVQIGTNITVSGPSALTVLTLPASSNSGPISPFDGVVDFSGPDTLSVFGLPASDSNSDVLFSGFAPYLGVGTVSFSYSSAANTFNSATVSPTISTTTPPIFDFDATVIYHYELVPEPSTCVLAALGAVGLAVAAWRRRRD